METGFDLVVLCLLYLLSEGVVEAPEEVAEGNVGVGEVARGGDCDFPW